jgi:hypothetical protein
MGPSKDRWKLRSNQTEGENVIIPNKWIFKLLLWSGTRLYPFVNVWSPNPDGLARVIHFACSERDFNIACRQRVDYLDSPGVVNGGPTDVS